MLCVGSSHGDVGVSGKTGASALPDIDVHEDYRLMFICFHSLVLKRYKSHGLRLT